MPDEDQLRRAVELAIARMDKAIERAGLDVVQLQETLRLRLQLEKARRRIITLEKRLKEKP